MDHATAELAAIRDPNKFVKIPNVVVFDEHSEYDEDGKLIRRFGREELQEVCDATNKRCEGGDPTVIGLGHTIPRDPLTKKPAPEKEQPVSVGYAMDMRVGQFGPEQKTGILTDYYIAKDKFEEWKSYLRGRSIEYWPTRKVIDWVASLRKAPQRDLGPLNLDLVTYSRDAIEPFEPTRRFYGDAAKTRILTMVVRGEKVMYSSEDFDMDPTKPPDAMAPDEDFAAKIERYMAEKYPSLPRMCQEATERYAAEGDPNAVGAPAGAVPEAPKPGEQPTADAPHGEMPVGGEAPQDADSTPDPTKKDTGAGTPSATNTSIPGSDGKKKKKPEDDDKEKLRMAADTEAIRYERLEKEVQSLREQAASAAAETKKAKATQRIQAHQYKGVELDPVREVTRYCAMDEKDWDAEDKYIEQFYRHDGIGHVPMGGMIPVGGEAPPPPASRGRLNEAQARQTVAVMQKKNIAYEDAMKEVLAGV